MIYLLLSLTLFALNNVLWKKNLQQVSLPILVGSRALLTSSISLIALYLTTDLQLISNFPILRVTLGSLFGALGLFCMLKVIKDAPLQWLGIYTLMGIILTTVYLLIFEEIEILKSLTGSTVILVGFSIYLHKNQTSTQKITWNQHFLLILMTIFYSLSSVFHWKNLDASVPAVFIIANQEMIVFTIAVMITLSTGKSNEIISGFRTNFTKVSAMALVIFFALLFSLLGLKATNPLISSILFLSSPLMTILFGAIFFKEKLSVYNAISILIIATGAFILHYQEMEN